MNVLQLVVKHEELKDALNELQHTICYGMDKNGRTIEDARKDNRYVTKLLLKEYDIVFKELGELENTEVTLHVEKAPAQRH